MIVGGGHNGLTAAAYLAKAGQSVLVLERRERLGGACTLERPFENPDFVVSPCAYVVGLLDEVVIQELQLRQRGLHVHVADPNLWVPFEDGTSFGQWLDDARTQKDLDDAQGQRRRPEGLLGLRAPLRRDPQAPAHRRARHLDRRVPVPRRARGAPARRADDDRRRLRRLDRRGPRRPLQATSGSRTRSSARAIIGAWAGPHDKGTALDQAHALPGRPRGRRPDVGLRPRRHGDDQLRDRRRRAGGRRHARHRRPRREILPDEGVVLEDGTTIHATTVVCNADPKVALRLLGDARARRAPRPASRTGSSAARWSSSTPRSTASRTGPPRPARTSPPAAPSTSPPASTPPRRPSTAAPPARPPSASARSTSRPCTTPAPRPPATTCSPCSASTRPTTSTGTTAARRSPSSSST